MDQTTPVSSLKCSNMHCHRAAAYMLTQSYNLMWEQHVEKCPTSLRLNLQNPENVICLLKKLDGLREVESKRYYPRQEQKKKGVHYRLWHRLHRGFEEYRDRGYLLDDFKELWKLANLTQTQLDRGTFSTIPAKKFRPHSRARTSNTLTKNHQFTYYRPSDISAAKEKAERKYLNDESKRPYSGTPKGSLFGGSMGDLVRHRSRKGSRSRIGGFPRLNPLISEVKFKDLEAHTNQLPSIRDVSFSIFHLSGKLDKFNLNLDYLSHGQLTEQCESRQQTLR